MSIPVELSDLATAMARYRFAYLLTGADQGAPHAIAITPTLDGSRRWWCRVSGGAPARTCRRAPR